MLSYYFCIELLHFLLFLFTPCITYHSSHTWLSQKIFRGGVPDFFSCIFDLPSPNFFLIQYSISRGGGHGRPPWIPLLLRSSISCHDRSLHVIYNVLHVTDVLDFYSLITYRRSIK